MGLRRRPEGRRRGRSPGSTGANRRGRKGFVWRGWIRLAGGIRDGPSGACPAKLGPQLLQPLEFLYRAPVQALGLSLVAQKQLNAVALAGQAEEAIGRHVVRFWARVTSMP